MVTHMDKGANASKPMLRNPQQDQMTHPHDSKLTNDIPEDKQVESTLSDAKTTTSNQSSNEEDSATSTKTYNSLEVPSHIK
ncbi:hypothetical protein BCR41DRAFT_392266 [Lobosporangium transversale]|uniref:Uncharacterized protein n=1 Tax=Lobosporangium transversale TaxID=64571 RepID=A0A1Y2GZW4_9FUNG|nr:hypothetical protein BCR41DRAFT_392266 [Lobosporangium transversale]ORZ27816.1 hypothetical protein BCR41DRAFT_392266 [Lobosporangium transversale]|eukprot:XP_021885519.1 hypothetical protein BCR41DRAFT_392266 [Lobosporangium transversale]